MPDASPAQKAPAPSEDESKLILEHKMAYGIPPMGKRVLVFTRNCNDHPYGVEPINIRGELKVSLWHAVLGDSTEELQGGA